MAAIDGGLNCDQNANEELKFEDDEDSFSVKEEELDDISSILRVSSNLTTSSGPPSLSRSLPESPEDSFLQNIDDEDDEQQLLYS